MALNAKDEVSQLLIDGKPATFGAIGLNPTEPVYPVVTQHSVQTFIHTKPKERRDAISAALGLEEVTLFKSALDGARRSFNLTPPPGVTAARAQVRGFAPTLATLKDTVTVAARWNQTPVKVDAEKDAEALVKAAQRLSGKTPASETELLEALRDARREVSKAVFDANKVSPIPAAEMAVSRLSQSTTPCREALDKVVAEAVQAAATTTAAFSSELLAFWETGLRLAPAHGDQCPMCESPTLTAQQREIIQGRVTAHKSVVAANVRLKSAVNQAVTALESLEHSTRGATVADLLPSEWETLGRLMTGLEPTLDKFRTAHSAQAESGRELESNAQVICAQIRALAQDLADVARAAQALENIQRVPDAVSTDLSQTARQAIQAI